MEPTDEHDFVIQGTVVDRAEKTLTVSYGWKEDDRVTFRLADDWFVVDGDLIRAREIIEDDGTEVITDLEEWSERDEEYQPASLRR